MLEYKIYYFGSQKINIKKFNDIQYTFESVSLETIELLENKINFILEEISKSDTKKINYLLYCEDLTKEYCDCFSKLLEKHISKGKLFMGMTLYNKTTNAHLSIQSIKGYKKIVNIFSFDHAIKVCDDKVFESVTLINKTITVIFDPTAPLEKCFTIWYEKKSKQSGGTDGSNSTNNNKMFNFRMMETTNSTDLESTWWFKYFFSIPPCAFGRLAQSTGTCWLNTSLNILFLSEPIANMLVSRYYNLPKDFKDQVEKILTPLDFYALEIPLKTIVWSMVNLFLVKSIKAITLDSNFLGVVASKIKGLWEYNNENYFIENNFGIEYGDGFISYCGLLVLISIYFEENVDYYKLFNSNAQFFDEIQKIANLFKEYDEIRSNLTDDKLEKLDQLEKQINKINGLNEKTQSIIRQMDETNKQICLSWDEITFNETKIFPENPPKLLIIPTIKCKQIHQVIYIGETEYKLIAGGINFKILEFNSYHIVAGLICGNKYYIYDSNNILSYTNWNQGIYNDYIEQLNEFYGVNGYSVEYTNQYVIYIKV